MSKTASQRRFTKRAEALHDLLENFPQQFEIVWTRLFAEWVGEIRFRAKAQRQAQAPQPVPAIYGVLENARRLADEINAQANPKVALSLQHLEHLCAVAVASCTDHRIYRVTEDSLTRVGMHCRAVGSGK